MNTLRLNIHTITLLASLLALCFSCSTGIEGTKMIKMSRGERKEVAPSAEDLLADSIYSQCLPDWKQGKRFLVADDKAAMIFEIPYAVADTAVRPIAGMTIAFDKLESRQTPGGVNTTVIKFKGDSGDLIFDTSKSDPAEASAVSGLDIPMLIDLDMVHLADSLIGSRMMWTRTQLWYAGDGTNFAGRKFVPVRVDSVSPGNMLFPLSVNFTDERGVHGKMYMNVKSSGGLGAESRTFASLFSLTDPRLKYPSIEDDVWNLICKGAVRMGMTKDECRLSLGNPDEVDSGHDWNSLIDIWNYKDGAFLQFQDGILVRFRR